MSKLKNKILVAQKSIQSPEVAPTHLPDIFLAESCTGILDSEIIQQFSIFIKNNLPSATSSYESSIKFQHLSSTSEHESKPLLLMFKSPRIAYPFMTVQGGIIVRIVVLTATLEMTVQGGVIVGSIVLTATHGATC